MSVSIIIPTYNHARFLRAALESALRQTRPALEVIVVDDGSTDETPEILAQFDDRICVRRQENRGPAAARNTGISAAHGDFLLFLDSDDVLLPACVELQLARFEAEPSLGLVYSDGEFLDVEGTLVRVADQGLQGRVARELLLLEGPVISAAGSGIMVPRRVAEEVGGFDDRLLASEDWDFCYRIASRYPVGRVARTLLHYTERQDGLHFDIPKMERGMLLAFEKAFSSSDPSVQSLRTRAYGRLHFILAGCYFEAHQPARFVTHLVKSARYDFRQVARQMARKITRAPYLAATPRT
ncbi:MAG TPA: glycosyltransferase family A protein [Thermoanaerobaculia bacterium]|jgi:glycosyltransferase involved in cell wall biosynthesis|nr:glycosyltransferase family A protein [Thermoanaerobaculia bacterium]